MELIKELGSRSWINGSGKKDSSKYGLFLCPSCNKEVEKALRKGIVASSCGNKECRKSTFKANPNNIGNTKFIKNEKIICKSTDSNMKSLNRIYYSMMDRNKKEKNKAYKYYGLQGTIVCDRWHDRKNFIIDMYEEYNVMHKNSDGTMRNKPSIDRINPFGNYTLENCKWVRFGENASKDKLIPIIRLDFDGNILESYESMSHAASVFSIDYGCIKMKAKIGDIHACCNNKQSHHLGYKWAFATNKITLQKSKI